jgi:hypothetical protein
MDSLIKGVDCRYEASINLIKNGGITLVVFFLLKNKELDLFYPFLDVRGEQFVHSVNVIPILLLSCYSWLNYIKNELLTLRFKIIPIKLTRAKGYSKGFCLF